MIFFILAFILSAYGSVSQNGKAKLIQGLPFSFYTYAETPPGQIAHGPAVFIPSAFLLDVVAWYLMAYLLIRFYDRARVILSAEHSFLDPFTRISDRLDRGTRVHCSESPILVDYFPIDHGH